MNGVAVFVVIVIVIVLVVLLFCQSGGGGGSGVGSTSCLCPAGSFGTVTASLQPNNSSSASGTLTGRYLYNSSGNKYLVIDSISASNLPGPVTSLVLEASSNIETGPWVTIPFASSQTVNGSFSASGIVIAPSGTSGGTSKDPVASVFLALDQQQPVVVMIGTGASAALFGTLKLST